MTKYKITIEVEADESVLPLKVEDVKAGIATYIDEYFTDSYPQHGWEEVSALVETITVDRRKYGRKSKTLEPMPEWITPEVADYCLQGKKIQAIKEVRMISHDAGTPLGLAEAKQIVDDYCYGLVG